MVEIARVLTIYCDKCGPKHDLDSYELKTIIGWAPHFAPPYEEIEWYCVPCSQELHLLW